LRFDSADVRGVMLIGDNAATTFLPELPVTMLALVLRNCVVMPPTPFVSLQVLPETVTNNR